MNASSDTPESLPPELAQLAQAARDSARQALATLPVLGHVTWLMLQQGATRNTLLGDLEWRVLPPLLHGQARVHMQGEAPLAYASWALLSGEAATRYRGAPHRLAAADWKSGDQVWLVDLITPFGGAQELLKELRQQFAGRPVYQLAPGDGQLAEVITWPALPRTPNSQTVPAAAPAANPP